MNRRSSAVAIVVCLLSFACSYSRPVPLPAGPEPDPLRETGPESAWPPQPAGATEMRAVPWTPGRLTDERIAGLRAAALADSRVRSALGDRFAYISTEEGELRKDRRDAARPFVLLFYSHARNAGIEVTMDDGGVRATRELHCLLPYGPEELRLSSELARSDERIARATAGLDVNAIPIEPRRGEPGHGNRVFYVSFSPPGSRRAHAAAIVDLTTNRLLSFSEGLR